MRKKALGLAALVSAGLFSAQVSAEFHRGYILIMGSTTAAPFMKAISEHLVKKGKFQTPLTQATGTSGGIKLFCEGLGAESPDIVTTARPMKPKELAECQTNGVGDVVELKIGYDAIVLAQSKKNPPISLTRKEARMALSKWVADESGNPVPNPYKKWKEINPALPDSPIQVFGPQPASGAYDAFVDMISGLECKGKPWSVDGKAEPTQDMLKKCRTLRDDGAYVEGRENDEDVVAHLGTSPGKTAIFDYRLLSEHSAHARAIPIDGVEPDPFSIASKAYAGTRPLYAYIKKANLANTPGLKEFIAEAASEHAWGENGYLKHQGMIVMPSDERATYVAELKNLGISPSTAASAGESGKKGGTKAAKAKPAAPAKGKEKK